MTGPAIDAAVVSSEDIAGTTVYDEQGNRVGRIDRLMIEKTSGRVVSAVITVAGFLGIGHSHREVPWQALAYVPELRGYQVMTVPAASTAASAVS